jgi:signal transduction histidine kinase
VTVSGQRGNARLMRRTTRLVGLIFVISSFFCIEVPGAAPSTMLLSVLPLYGIMTIGLYLIGGTQTFIWLPITFVTGLGTIWALGFDRLGGPTESTVSAATLLGAGGLASLSILFMGNSWRLGKPWKIGWRVGWVVLAFGTTAALTELASDTIVPAGSTVAIVFVGWLAISIVGYWMSVSVARALNRVNRLGLAHLAERQATEVESMRRQGARLMHDTVLATLTLLAHSGVGVSPDALREQAAEDARLLRQLRLGGTPMPRETAGYMVEATETTELGHTLESVRQRCLRMGLDVSWHGAGRILLRSTVLDAFLLSLGECLENVRRHSGVGAADVTITEDDTTVRAVVTDAGVGFDPGGIGGTSLGISESIVARMHDVGGRTRLFSAPGSGTTVVIEAPK